MPDADYLKELFRETGVDTDKYPIESPVDSYFFDEHTPGLKPGRGGWRIEMLSGLKRGDRNFANAPYDDKVMSDIARCVETFAAFHDQPGAPDEPPDLSSPRFDDLASMSFAAYLTDVLHCDPRVVDFYTAYTVDCMGGTAHQVNAHTVISFLSSDYSESSSPIPAARRRSPSSFSNGSPSRRRTSGRRRRSTPTPWC